MSRMSCCSFLLHLGKTSLFPRRKAFEASRKGGLRLFHNYSDRGGQNFFRRSTSSGSSGNGAMAGTFAFVGLIGIGSYTLASIFEYEREKEYLKRHFQSHSRRLSNLFFSKDNNISSSSSSSSNGAQNIIEQIQNVWDRTSLGQKMIYFIVAGNAIVFGLWQIPAMYGFMSRYFVSSPNAPVITLLTSCFSHSSLLHFGFNMMALVSLGSFVADRALGPEHFLHVYLTGGVLSG